MKSSLKKQAERFLREQKNYKRWLAVFLCLAVVVTIGTTAALKYKGIAVTTDNPDVEVHTEDEEIPEGMRRHVHTEACYEEQPVLVCEAAKAEAGETAEAGAADAGTSNAGAAEEAKPADTAQGHVHSDSCYEVTGGTEKLTCTKEEHTHSDGCYETKVVTETVTKTVPETVNEEVTDEDGNVTTVSKTVDKTVEETVEKEEKVLTCTKEEHSHGASCYTVEGGERTLVCGKEEGEAAEISGAEAVAETAEAEIAETKNEEAENAEEEVAETKDSETESTGAEDSNADGENAGEHVHDESCYELQMVLICGKEEGELEEFPEGEFAAGMLSCEGEDYEVIVSYSAEAEIPADAELSVEELEADSDAYRECYEQMVEELSADEDGEEVEVTFARFFDIKILVDGAEIEPKAEVAVQISYDDVITEDEEQNGFAVHFPDDGEMEILDADVRDGKEFGFNQSSFSPTGTVYTAKARAGEREETIVLNGDDHEIFMEPGDTIILNFITTDNSSVDGLYLSGETQSYYMASKYENRKVKVDANFIGRDVGFWVNGWQGSEVYHDYVGSPTWIKVTVQDQSAANYKISYDLSSGIEGTEIIQIGGGKGFTDDEVSVGTVVEEYNEFLSFAKCPEYILVKNKGKNGDYQYFVFDYWETENGTKIDGFIDKSCFTEENIENETDENGNVTAKILKLRPVWKEEKQMDVGTLLPRVQFYVALNSVVQETGNTETIPQKENFTKSVYETTTNGIYEQVNRSVGNRYMPIIYKDEILETKDNVQRLSGKRRVLVSGDEAATAEIDTTIRSLATTGVNVTSAGGSWTYKLANFPTDEEILAKIRSGNYRITVGGESVDLKDITTDNFAVRWYVFKHDITDEWHIDGILVRKQGKLVVTKTFYGDQDAVKAVKDGSFNITVTENGKSSPDYTLKLHKKTANDGNSDLGYTEVTTNDSEVTYVWELGVTAGKTFKVKENNYRYTGNKEIATLPEYRISNTEIDDSGSQIDEGVWKDYIDDTGVSVKTESYASDLTYKSFRTVNLRNSYLPKNSITVWKYDEASNSGLAGVTFRLKKGGEVQEVYKKGTKGTDYYLYSEDNTTLEMEELKVDSSGYLTIHGVEGNKAGDYVLEEVNCPSGYTKKSISFKINDNGTVTGNEIKLVDEGYHAYRLNISNGSEKMKVTAVKDWGAATDKKSVEVELWRGNTKLENAVELNAGNNWTHTYRTEYPVYVDGKIGEYRLVETKIGDTYRDPGADVDGYQFYDVTVDPLKYDEENRTGTITVHNTVNGGRISFTKTAEDKTTPLQGAKFALYADDGCSGEKLAQATSSKDGSVIFIGLTNEIYYMKEVEAPAGYQLSEQIYKVTFEDKEGKIELYTASEAAEGTPEGESAESGPIRVITNEPATQTIDIIKVDAAGETRLNGAEFTLTGDKLEAERTYTSRTEDSKAGVVVKGLGLPYGTYTLTETKAPENYMPAGQITLTVDENGVTAGGTESDFTLSKTETAPASLYILKVRNTQGLLNGITLTKISDENSNTKLGGAEFVLGRKREVEGTAVEEYALIEDNTVKDWVGSAEAATSITTEDGTGTGTLPALEAGSYFLTEIKAPEGYNLLTAPVNFEIQPSQLSSEEGKLKVAITDGSAALEENSRNIIISNSKGVVLPEAGGPGTTAYTLGGLAVIAISLMYGLSMRRKREKGGLN